MIKQTVKYENYNGVEVTEDLYFNLSKAEIIEIGVEYPGGLEAYIKEIVAANDNKKIMELFKFILSKSYGVKSPDGKRFIKNQEVLDSFMQSEAYTEMFLMILQSEEKAAEFVNGVIPKNINKAK